MCVGVVLFGFVCGLVCIFCLCIVVVCRAVFVVVRVAFVLFVLFGYLWCVVFGCVVGVLLCVISCRLVSFRFALCRCYVRCVCCVV